jgi:group I intron endonuclease
MIIYKTKNKITGKIYIGQDKNNNSDYLGSGKILKQSIEKHGKENFEKETLEECYSKEHLDLSEKYWILYYNSTNRNIGYNIAIGGSGGDTISNHPDREEICKKISNSSVGRKPWNYGKSKTYKMSPEFGRKISERMIGHSHSEETKNKIGDANRGRKVSDETKKKISEANKGKVMPVRTDEWKQNHSEFMTVNNPMFWYIHTEESRKKMSEANKDKPKSEEHRKKMSNANKGSKPPNMVKVEIDGVIFESVTDASRKTGINMSTLRNRIKSKNYEGYMIHEETAD